MSRSVVVIGLGYIGLPTAVVLASRGVSVVGVDVSEGRVDLVNRSELPFVEPEMDVVLASVVQRGLLTAQTETPAADTYLIAVPTPFADEHQADLRYIDDAADGIIPQLKGGELIILESTSPPGTTQGISDRIVAARPDLQQEDGSLAVDIAHCPERVLPGRVMTELVNNDRIVGGLTPRAAQRAKDLYSVFCEGDIYLTDAVTAELAKLAENSFRDVNIAFANELSLVADRVGVDVFELIELANKHPRVSILQPGPGVGGHCIAVDPWFIVSAAPEESRLIRTAREVNDAKPLRVVEKVMAQVEGIDRPTIAALGLAFKPDIDDLRESPATSIVAALSDQLPQGRILAVEPNIEQLSGALASHSNVELSDLDSALDQADVVVLLVDHRQFKTYPAAASITAPIVDTRGIWRRSAGGPA